MRLLPVFLLLCAAPVVAGTWDPNYVWDSGKTVFGGYPDEDGNLYTSLASWGLPLESPPKSIYGETSGTFGRPKAPDRLGRMDSQYGAQLDWTAASGGKIKWRFDHSPEGNRVPPGGHSPDYSTGVASSIALGLMICGGDNYLGYATGSGLTAFVPGDSGYPRIQNSGATGSMTLRWYNTVQTITPTGGGDAFLSNWKPNDAAVLEATGNWLMPANTWATVQLIFNNDAARTWEAILVREGLPVGHMSGTYSGSAAASDQFGITSTAYSQGIAYDYLAFGWGSVNIGRIPEPASLMLFGMAVLLIGRRRTR